MDSSSLDLAVTGRILLGDSKAKSSVESFPETTKQPLNMQLLLSSHETQNAAPLISLLPFEGTATQSLISCSCHALSLVQMVLSNWQVRTAEDNAISSICYQRLTSERNNSK